jgi:hypothetical protein
MLERLTTVNEIFEDRDGYDGYDPAEAEGQCTGCQCCGGSRCGAGECDPDCPCVP